MIRVVGFVSHPHADRIAALPGLVAEAAGVGPDAE
jgi:hypothetical protein